MAGVTIPPSWNFKNNASDNLKRLLLAQMIGFASHKGTVAKALEDITPSYLVNGKMVYHPAVDLRHRTSDYTSKESILLKNLVGIDDAGLQEIANASGDADTINLRWIRRTRYEKQDYQNVIQMLKDEFIDVTTIDISSTMVSYYINQMMENPSFIVADAIGTDRSIYDTQLTGFTFQNTTTEILYTKLSDTSGDWNAGISNTLLVAMTYDDRVPIEWNFYNTNAFDYDLSLTGAGNFPIASRYDASGETVINEETILRNSSSLLHGEYQPTIILKNSIGTNITANYEVDKLRALMSVILISGTSFMNKIGGLVKTSETLSDYNYSYYVTGTQQWDATILQSFIDDASETYFNSYTLVSGADRYFPLLLYAEYEYENYYGKHLWYYRDRYNIVTNIEELSNGLFMYYNGITYLTVDGLKTCSEKEYAEWIFSTAYIKVSYDSGGFLGIGGFLGDFLGFLVSAIATILGEIIDIFKEIFILTLKITGIYYMLEALGMSEENFDLMAEIGAHIALAIITLGVSEYAELAYLGAEMSVITMEHIALMVGEELATMSLTTLGVKAIGIGTSIINSQTNENLIEEERKNSNKKKEEAEEEIRTNISSLNEDEKTNATEFNYNPFYRKEIIDKMRYGSFIINDYRNPFDKILS